MSMSFRRSAVGTGVLSLLFGLLQLAVAPLARAAEPEPVLFYLDHFVPNDSHGYQVMRRDAGGSTHVVHDFGYLGPDAVVSGPAVSVRTETLAVGFRRKVGGHMATDVYLMDESGTSMRSVWHVVDDAHYFSVIDFNPSGSELWIDESNDVDYTHSTWILDVRTGTFGRLGVSSAYARVFPDPQAPSQFFADTASAAYHVANGTATRIDHGGGYVSGVGPAGDLVVVSYADHTEIASRDGSVLNPDLGPANRWDAAFSPAETWVYSAISTADHYSGGAIARDDVTQSAQTPQVIVTAEDGDHDLERPAVAPADANPPGAASLRVTPAGAHPVLHIANPSDEDFSHAVLRRYNGATATGNPVTTVLPWHATSYRDSVTINGTYTYTVTAVDGAGNEAPATSLTMQALVAPTLRMPRIASDISTAPPFKVSWQTASHPAGTTYQVQYDASSLWYQLEWKDWFAATTAESATYGASGQPLTPRTKTPNHVRVRAKDPYGNATAWVGGKTLEPVDDDGYGLTYSPSWSTAGNAANWGGSIRMTRKAGATFTVKTPLSKSVFIIGDRCPSCGSFRVYFGTRLVGTFSSHASVVKHRRVLAVVSVRSMRKHNVKLVNVPTKLGAQLRIDAVVHTWTQEAGLTFP